MNMDTTFPALSDDLRGAVLSSYTNVADDGTLCFISDKQPRTCPDCGTVFVGSACGAVLPGLKRCPYCGEDATQPLAPRRFS